MSSLFRIDIEVSTNEDFREAIVLRETAENSGGGHDPIDLTGHSFRQHIRRSVESLSEFQLDADNGRLTVLGDPVDGVLAWHVEDEDLRALGAGTYVHDIVWIFPDGAEVQFAIGSVTITQGITR
ncbi:MAG: hypothetical protein M9939_26545 [Mesorhizobium sp.]|nr:hypothetical protein [Mesorhizobium sp.]MCO5164653.1 hypothetical protein [Mesorhizobium sp.]